VGTCTREQYHPNARILASITESVVKLKNCFWTEGITLMGAIYSDFGDSPPFMVKNILVGFDGLPFNGHSLGYRHSFFTLPYFVPHFEAWIARIGEWIVDRKGLKLIPFLIFSGYLLKIY
jgi:hypothetical protein